MIIASEPAPEPASEPAPEPASDPASEPASVVETKQPDECNDDTKFKTSIKGFLLQLDTPPILSEHHVLRTGLEFVFAAKHLKYSACCFGINSDDFVTGADAQACIESWWPQATICSIDEGLNIAAQSVRELKVQRAPPV
jgi:hypothetical protein